MGGFRVVLRHLGIRPAEDRHQLMFGSTCLGEDRRRRLSQAVRRAFRQIRVVAPLAHLVAKAIAGERLAIFVDEECGLIMRDLIHGLAKLVCNGQADRLRVFFRPFLRHEFDAISDQVPPTEFDKV
ncbi:hypothetical protein PL599_05035 [Agrobacterium sp. ST15.16.055]|nr:MULTISPECIES: hypothetical protein [Agrobacterium]MDA5628026.1 hypothetical protein [Agrobacterium sp. ST15.16.055]MDA6978228.1 hypothetical protein [Agrobacterium salinitolerans]